MSAAITLTVSHNLWLTREERYQLQEGIEVTAVGAYSPVWFHKGSTSEPAQEVFGRYHITTTGPHLSISSAPDGFNVNVPRDAYPRQLPASLWESMSEEDREIFWKINGRPSLVDGLKDLNDGGSEWYFFRFLQRFKRDDEAVANVVHTIEMKDINQLTETLA